MVHALALSLLLAGSPVDPSVGREPIAVLEDEVATGARVAAVGGGLVAMGGVGLLGVGVGALVLIATSSQALPQEGAWMGLGAAGVLFVVEVVAGGTLLQIGGEQIKRGLRGERVEIRDPRAP